MTDLQKLTAVLDEIGVDYNVSPSLQYLEIKHTTEQDLPADKAPLVPTVTNIAFNTSGQYKSEVWHEFLEED